MSRPWQRRTMTIPTLHAEQAKTAEAPVAVTHEQGKDEMGSMSSRRGHGGSNPVNGSSRGWPWQHYNLESADMTSAALC
jgi:hypothetical protein